MSRLTGDGTAELASRDQILRRVRGHGNIHLVGNLTRLHPYSAICDDHTYQAHTTYYIVYIIKYSRLSVGTVHLLDMKRTEHGGTVVS